MVIYELCRVYELDVAVAGVTGISLTVFMLYYTNSRGERRFDATGYQFFFSLQEYRGIARLLRDEMLNSPRCCVFSFVIESSRRSYLL